MDEPAVKGFELISVLRTVDEHLDGEQRARFEASLSEDFRRERDQLRPGGWYPIDWSEQLDRAFIAAHQVGEGKPAADLIEHFAGINARRNQTTVLKLLMRFLKPHSLVRVIPKLWRRYYNRGTVQVLELSKEDRRARLALLDFPYKRYMPTACVGWIKEAFVAMGIEDAEVRVLSYDPTGPARESYEFELRWGKR